MVSVTISDQLYDHFFEAFESKMKPSSDDELLFVRNIANIAVESTVGFLDDLVEANAHLLDTVRRLTKGDNRATVS